MSEKIFGYNWRLVSVLVFIFGFILATDSLFSQESEALRCSATFFKTEFGAGLTKHLESDGTITLKDKYNQVLLDGVLRAEVISWDVHLIAYRSKSGKDGLMSFEGTTIIDGMDDIYVIDSSKRILGLKNNGLFGVMIFSDSLVKRKIKEKQSVNSPIIVFINDDKNLTQDESLLSRSRLKDIHGIKDAISEEGVKKFQKDRSKDIEAIYRRVKFYSKGKTYTLGDSHIDDMNVELIIVESAEGYKGVFDGYGNEVLALDYRFDSIQIINKNTLIAHKASKEYRVEIREHYVTLYDGDHVESIYFE